MTGARSYFRTTLLSTACLGVLAGLWLARTDNVIAIGLLVCVGGAVLYPRTRYLAMAAMCGLLIGWARGLQYEPRLTMYESLRGQVVMLRGMATEDSIYGKDGQLTFDVAKITANETIPLSGKMQVAGRGTQMVYKGDRITARGKLYPSRGSRQARVSYATINVESRSNELIDKVRRNYMSGMLSALPEPHASFGMGLLVGQRDTLPKDVADDLSTVGLTHLIAVSGYNLTIIIMFARRGLGQRSKYQTTIGAVVLMILFLLVTGFSASIVRAALVSGMSLLAWYYGRNVKPFLLIVSAAAITALWHPFFVWTDIGWYLSFLAFFGVLVIAPLILSEPSVGNKQPGMVKSVAAESFSAQLMTIPIILYIFGRFSPVSLLANLLVVPLVPYAMLAALTAGIVGSVAPVAAGVFAWPAKVVLSYMLSVVSLTSDLPFASTNVRLSLSSMLGIYVIIVLTVLVKQRRSDHDDMLQ